MQTQCDKCKGLVKKVGRLTNVKWGGFQQKLCKTCRKKVRMSLR